MECNKDDALRSKEIAERKFRENDIAGAKKFALKAKALFKTLDGIDQMISALDVHIRGQRKMGEENDWYGILEVSPLADEETIKKQYKKLVLQIHPDKNSSICADGAFNLISDAWTVLSDTSKRVAYDQKRAMCRTQVHHSKYNASVGGTSSSSMSSVNGSWRQNSGPGAPRKVPPNLAHIVPDTFWTYCGSCFVNFQYSREYVNRHLKCTVCKAVFVAVEVPPPSSPDPTATTDNNIGGTTVPDMTKLGIQAGVAPGNQNYDPTRQQWSFLKSTTCAHSTRYTVQQKHESARKREADEADTTANEESNIRTKMQVVRKHAHAGSSLGRANAATKELESAKRRRANEAKHASRQISSCCDGDLQKPMLPAKRKPRTTAETSGAKKRRVSSGDHIGESSSNAGRTSFGRVLMQLDVRGILIENMKLQLWEKLNAFNIKDNVKKKENVRISKKIRANIACGTSVDVNKSKMKQSNNSVHTKEADATELISKIVDSEEKQMEKNNKAVSSQEKGKLCQWRSREVYIVYTRRNRKEHKKEQGDDTTDANSTTEQHFANKHGCLNQEPSSDESTSEMSVPDADFYKFGDHPENSFQNDQVWAVYDEEDGMPRYYALIRKVLSTHPFKVRVAYLKANDCNEFGASKWISCGYSKTCGEFKAGVSKDAEQLNIFSHKINNEKGPGNIIRICPKKGDIWALYQNWSCHWDEFTPDDTLYKYKLVEVLDNYSPTNGISVMPIEKIPGFVAVFKPHHDTTKIWRIPKEEMLRFSHQVPFHVLTGKEAPNAPKGCYELDPASTPKELLQVIPLPGVAKQICL